MLRATLEITEYKLTAVVWKKDEEMAINLICIISVLMIQDKIL